MKPDLVLLARAVFSVSLLWLGVFCFLGFGCQYRCNQLPGKTRLRNDLLCVEWDVKPYTLTHSLTRGTSLIRDHVSIMSRL